MPAGTVVPFNDLSAGEKEVFFVLAFFLRHDVGSAVILIDEPELHPHPEPGRTLLQQMMTIREGNQIWVATHNPEIVDEAGRDRVVYISRNPSTHDAVVAEAADEAAAVTALRDFFGFQDLSV